MTQEEKKLLREQENVFKYILLLQFLSPRFVHSPFYQQGSTRCADEALNKIKAG